MMLSGNETRRQRCQKYAYLVVSLRHSLVPYGLLCYGGARLIHNAIYPPTNGAINSPTTTNSLTASSVSSIGR